MFSVIFTFLIRVCALTRYTLMLTMYTCSITRYHSGTL